MSTIIAPSFLKLMLTAAQEVQKDTSKRVHLAEFPEFVAFFAEKEPESYFHDVTKHLHIDHGGVYIDYAPEIGENPMLRYVLPYRTQSKTRT